MAPFGKASSHPRPALPSPASSMRKLGPLLSIRYLTSVHAPYSRTLLHSTSDRKGAG